MKPYISELIKIAYEHDELRNDLVPLIQGELKVARRGKGRNRRRFKDMESNRGRQRANEGARRLQQQEREQNQNQSSGQVEIELEQPLYSDGEVQEVLSNFSFIAHIKREHYGSKWLHPETELQNTINTIVEKARDGDEFAIDLVMQFWAEYEESEGSMDEQFEGLKNAFDDLDLTDFRQGEAVGSFCSLVSKSMNKGSWTGRNTLIGELVDDTLWSIDASYAPLIRALKDLHKAIDKNQDGVLQKEEIVDYIKLAASSGLDLDMGEAASSGVTASLLKNALEEVLISAIMAKMTFGKNISGKIGKRIVAKVISHLLGSITDKVGINDAIDDVTSSAVDFVANKVDSASGKVGVGRVGTAMKRRAEAASLVPSKINSKYKEKVQSLIESLGSTPTASELEDVANQALKLAEQYFSEGAAEIDNAISDSLLYKAGDKLTPNFLQNVLLKLGSEGESEVDKYVLEKMQNPDNHTGIVLSYLQQQLATMRAEMHIAENIGPLAQDIYEEFLSKLENKEERDAVLDMIKEQEQDL